LNENRAQTLTRIRVLSLDKQFSVRRRGIVRAFAATAAAAFVAPAFVRANARAAKLISLEPGAQTDSVARLLQPPMEQSLGQEVYVENHGGAGGRIAARIVASSRPDGLTMGVGGANNLVLAGFIGRDIGYDPKQDFTFVCSLARIPFAIGVQTILPIRNIADLVRYARANPGKLNFGSAGVGGSSHLALEAIAQHYRLDLLHVPYRGSSLATNELVGGRIDVVATDLNRLLPLAKADKLRIIALTGSSRAKSAAHIETLHEQGLSGFHLDPWYGLYGPKGLDKEIVNRWTRAAVDAFNDKATQARAEAAGVELVPPSAETLANWIENDRLRYSALAGKLDLRSMQ
jgi:tripartite-type tricarboxylate transporter receptor subunit TctC